MKTFSCPQCGDLLAIEKQQHAYVAYCSNFGCRARACNPAVVSRGRTVHEAADNFVEKCEINGHTDHLTAVIRELLHTVPPT